MADIIVKPSFDHGGGGFLFDEVGEYIVYDADGNELDRGRVSGKKGEHGYKVQSGAISEGQGSYFTFNGQRYDLTNPGKRHEYIFGNSSPSLVSDKGAYGTSGPAGTNLYTTPGGNVVVLPQGADFSSLPERYIDLQSAYDDAYTQGDRAKENLFGNYLDPRTSQAALSLVKTDTQGILDSASVLAPFNRQQGDLDTQTNIKRAGQIDEFNISRVPRMNEINRQEKSKSVDATGISYKDRINGLLDNLSAQARGELPAGLEKSFRGQNYDKAADVSAARGVSALSGAGISFADRLDATTRLDLALKSQTVLGNELNRSQQQLESPNIQVTPTNVPLNVSNVADRLPVVSSISAGQAMGNIANKATELSSIDATTALSTNLNTQKYNEEAAYDRELTILKAEQGIITATENKIQEGFNSDKQDILNTKNRDERDRQALVQNLVTLGGLGLQNYDKIYELLFGKQPKTKPSDTGDTTGGQGSTTSTDDTYEGLSTSDPGHYDYSYTPDNDTTVGSDVVTDYNDTYFDSYGNDYMSNVARSGSIESASLKKASLTKNMTPADVSTKQAQRLASNPKFIASLTPSQKVAYDKDSVAFAKNHIAKEANNSPYKKATNPVGGLATDRRVLMTGLDALATWNTSNTGQRVGSAGSLGISVLENRGLINAEESRNLNAGAGAISVLSNDSATDGEKATALASLSTILLTDGYTGDIDSPKTIGSQEVVGSRKDPNGNVSYKLKDGTFVSKSYLQNVDNTLAGLKALQVVFSKASDANKALALTSIGLNTAAANDIVSKVNAGYGQAALSILGTAMNWKDMNDVQKTVSVVKTGMSIMDAYTLATDAAAKASSSVATSSASTLSTSSTSGSLASTGVTSTTSSLSGTGASASGDTAVRVGADTAASNTAQTSTLSYVSQIGSAALSAYSIYQGVDGSLKHADAMSDQNRSDLGGNVATGTANGVSVGAGAGALVGTYVFPVLGTAAGAVVGAIYGGVIGAIGGAVGTLTASTKDKSQMMRDNYRKGLKETGIIEVDKKTNAYNVQLADGQKFDIGLDGSNKIKNKDGKERYTFDVDWENSVAVDTVPDANLFVIATGIDPTSGNKMDLFSRSSAQILNAATSNAKTTEDVRNNLRSMTKGKVDPGALSSRLEYLRLSNKITEQEYGVYIDRVNKIYNTKFKPSQKQDAYKAFIDSLSAVPEKERTKEQKEMLKALSDKDNRSKSIKELEDRLNTERKNRGEAPITLSDDLNTDISGNFNSSPTIKGKPNVELKPYSDNRGPIETAIGKPKQDKKIDAKPFVRLDGKKQIKSGVRPTYGR
jgi:hypothetical protein